VAIGTPMFHRAGWMRVDAGAVAGGGRAP
jgi:hypothetical protein